jgi:hypothetical protein
MECPIFGLLFLVFLYFGYRDDFSRDKKGLKKTILGVLLIGSIYLILGQIELEIPIWISLSILIIFVLINVFLEIKSENSLNPNLGKDNLHALQ